MISKPVLLETVATLAVSSQIANPILFVSAYVVTLFVTIALVHWKALHDICMPWKSI